MAVQSCGLKMNRDAREYAAHGTQEYPCAAYDEIYDASPDHVISWHWHEEAEIVYVESGEMTFKIPSDSYVLRAGDCMIFNGNVPHYGEASCDAHLQSMVFHPRLIYGSEQSALAVKYVLPVVMNTDFQAVHFPGHVRKDMTGWFLQAFEAQAGDIFGYEFLVRENLSRIFLELYRQLATGKNLRPSASAADSQRIQKMMEYIHVHYAEDMELADIASAADVGDRECMRCFKRTIQISPMQYLMKYRIMKGAELLLAEPDLPISIIAGSCGFESQSNFTKMFKRYYQCTPSRYRKTATE